MLELNKINKKKIDFFKRNGFLILRNILKKSDLALIDKRLKFLENKQKDGRGLSEPGIRKSLIHSLGNDKILYPIIEWNKVEQQLLLFGGKKTPPKLLLIFEYFSE